MRHPWTLLPALALAFACDSASAPDASSEPRRDAGATPEDAGPPLDASSALDAGRAPDAGSEVRPCDGPLPAPTGVLGLLRHGERVEVTGTCFGERAVATPLEWDDAESAYDEVVDGASVPTGDGYPFAGNPDGRIRFATAASRSVRGVSRAHYLGDGAEHNHNTLRGHDYGRTEAHREMYLSWYVRLDARSSDRASAKLLRLWAGDHNGRTYRLSWTTMHLTYGYSEDRGTEADPWATTSHTLADTPSWSTWSGEDALEAWHRVELYFRQSSSPDDADGRILCLTDGRVEHDLTAATWIAERPARPEELRDRPRFGDDPPNRLALIGLDPSVPIGDYVVELDDVYVDSTLARVELCDVARWSDRPGATCEIQPESAWGDDRVGVQLNRGALADGDAYLYVIRPDGAVNEEGLAVRLGG